MNFKNSFTQSGRFNTPVKNGGFSSDRQKYKGNFATYNQHNSFGSPMSSSSYAQGPKGIEASNNRSSFSNNRLPEANRRKAYDSYPQRGSFNQPQMAFACGNSQAVYGQQSMDYARGNKQQSRVYNNHYVIPDRATRRSFYNDPSLDSPEVDYYNYDGQYLPSEVRAKRKGDPQRRSSRSRFFSNLATRSGRGTEEEYNDRGYEASGTRSRRRVEEEYDDRRCAAPEGRSRRRIEEERGRPRDYSREIEEDQYYEEDGYGDDCYEERMPRKKRKVATKRAESREENYDDYDDYGDDFEDEEYEEVSSRNFGKVKKPVKRMVCREEEDDDDEAPVKKSSGINFFKKKKRQ